MRLPRLLAAALLFSTLNAITTVEEQATTPILTPNLAERHTKKILLDNGLRALLISDPTTHQSGALLTVDTGSWEDPDAYPGLAHFLEHMLFLGTKSYPEEKSYQRYISNHGGTTNAFTASHYTSYLFSVDNDGFVGALDRFSSFFKEPLLSASGVGRELQAVDQEFAKNSEDDHYREYLVYKEQLDPAHPNSKFKSGNHATLESATPEVLRKWYQEHYSANLMTLVVVSPLPLDELVNLVDKDFSAIAKTRSGPYLNEKSYTPPEATKKIIYLEPIKNSKELTLIWELPARFSLMYDSRPAAIACHILGHEGEESLLAQLKREELAEKLSCGIADVGRNKQEIQLQIALTDKGLDQLDLVISRLFQALAAIREKGLAKPLYDDISGLAALNYKYQERKELFEELMEHGFQVSNQPFASYPESGLLLKKYDPDAFADLIDQLTPDNAMILVMAPKKAIKKEFDKKEPWLQVPYTIVPVSNEQLKEWKEAKPHPAITLPADNPFIPQNLSLAAAKPEEGLLPQPTLLVENEKGLYYYSSDNRFGVPKAALIFTIKTPQVQAGNATQVVLADLYVKALQEALKPYSYPAQMADFDYSIEREFNGISIKISGYSDTAPLLLEKILEAAAGLQLSDEKFLLYKQELLKDYQNFSHESPIKQNVELLSKAVRLHYSTEKAKAAAIRKVTAERFRTFAESLFSKNYVQGLLYGNLNKEQAKKLADLVEKKLGGIPYPKKQQLKNSIIDLPNDQGPFLISYKTKAAGNSLILAIEMLPYSLKMRAMQQLLSSAIEAPFFHELRTHQQTGYIVQETAQEVEKHLFTLFLVQSSSYSPRDLLARFELFIEQFLRDIETEELPPERYEKIRSSLVEELKKPAKNLRAMGSLLNALAFDYEADFHWFDKRIAAMQQLTYPEFIALVKEQLGSSNRKRLALMIEGKSSALEYTPILNIEALKSVSSYTP